MALYDNKKNKEDIEEFEMLKVLVQLKTIAMEKIAINIELIRAKRKIKEILKISSMEALEKIEKHIEYRRKEVKAITREIHLIMKSRLRKDIKKVKIEFKGSKEDKKALIKDMKELVSLRKKKDELYEKIDIDTQLLEKETYKKKEGVSRITDYEYINIANRLMKNKVEFQKFCIAANERVIRIKRIGF